MSRYAKAAHAFEDFTGDRPTKVRRARLDDKPVTAWQMGPAVGVAYEAVRDGEKAQYFHEFAKKARPTLVARDDGRQLYLIGGDYTVTERGIEDMPDMFIVNPSSRGNASPKRKTMALPKRSRSGRFLKGGGGNRKARRASTSRRRAPTRQVALFTANPTPKRRRPRRAAAKRSAGKTRRYRRNPSGRKMLGGIGSLLMPAAGVAGGAVGIEILMGYIPFPAAWKSGLMRQVTKGALGVAVGYGVGKFLKQKKLGFYLMAGALVIAVHDGIKEVLTARAPAIAGRGAFGQYVNGPRRQFAGRGMGYVNPARVATMGQYVAPLASQFAGDAPLFARPGGETNFVA